MGPHGRHERASAYRRFSADRVRGRDGGSARLAEGRPLFVDTDSYADLVPDEATVASLSWDLDRPGGGDVGWLDRHGDHYLVVIQNSDVFEYLGQFESPDLAIAALEGSSLSEGARVRRSSSNG